MPCNGVAVASAQIEADKVEIWNGVEVEVRTDYLGRVLELAGVEPGAEVRGLPRRPGEVHFIKGDTTVLVEALGRVTVVTAAGGRAFASLVEALVTDGIDTLVGAVLQMQAVQAIQAAGVAITNNQQAPNGAIVLSVEI
jgi:hypothetical protein